MIHVIYYKRLIGFLKPNWQFLFGALFTTLLMAAILAYIPILFQHILSAAFIEKNVTTIQTALLTIMLLVIIHSLAIFSHHWLMQKAVNHIGMQLYTALFNKLFYLSAQQYQALGKQETTNTALASINKLSKSTVRILTTLVRDIMAIIGLMLCMFWLDKDFALLVCILIPFILIMMQVIQDQQTPYFQAEKKALADLTTQLHESIKKFRQIRLHGGQQQECKRFHQAIQSIQENRLKLSNFKSFVATLCQLVILLIIMAISYLLTQQILKNTFTLEQAGAFIAAILLMIIPIKRLACMPSAIQLQQKPLEQLFALLDLKTVSEHDRQTLTKAQGALIFEQVSLVSPTQKNLIFRPSDLVIQPGETVAIVCEKKQFRTLFIDLILGFCPPATGKIQLDGHSYAQTKHADLMAQFSMISNEPVILDDHIAGNIAYGATQCACEAKITKAAQMAQATGFIREMPEGLQTHINENDATLTQRQWLQIAIARALLRNAPVLIIDDLWPQIAHPNNEQNKALDTLIKQCTTIILMHAMPDSWEKLDRVLLLENGTITEGHL